MSPRKLLSCSFAQQRKPTKKREWNNRCRQAPLWAWTSSRQGRTHCWSRQRQSRRAEFKFLSIGLFVAPKYISNGRQRRRRPWLHCVPNCPTSRLSNQFLRSSMLFCHTRYYALRPGQFSWTFGLTWYPSFILLNFAGGTSALPASPSLELVKCVHGRGKQVKKKEKERVIR